MQNILSENIIDCHLEKSQRVVNGLSIGEKYGKASIESVSLCLFLLLFFLFLFLMVWTMEFIYGDFLSI